ncbi:UNVERIFIED_CONTAM: hypothetical protein RMT77_000634 [Armadillidium vulgare]
MMNFIGRKFSPAKSPPRRSISLNSLKRSDRNQSDISAEFNKIRINFGDQKAKFKDGEWITDLERSDSSQEVERLRESLKNAEQENNLLRLKVEILLDMLTEKSAENLLKGKEIAKQRTQR